MTDTDSERSYLATADEIDMEHEEMAIQKHSTAALVITLLAFGAAYYVVGPLVDFPTELAERLRFGVLNSVFILLWVLVGVGMVSTGRRKSAQDIGGSAAGPPSEKLAIKSAFLQNTLEQAVLASTAVMAWVVLVDGAWLALVPVAVVVFAVGRILFYRGYPKGASGRAFGMSLTMSPALLGIPAAVVLVIIELAGMV